MIETYLEMMQRKNAEYEAHKNDPKPVATTCRNHECPLKIDGSCGYNIWTDGLKCAGNETGHHYRSQQQAIYSDYEKKCEREGIDPMHRGVYFEF